jgi:hypothetical protein
MDIIEPKSRTDDAGDFQRKRHAEIVTQLKLIV